MPAMPEPSGPEPATKHILPATPSPSQHLPPSTPSTFANTEAQKQKKRPQLPFPFPLPSSTARVLSRIVEKSDSSETIYPAQVKTPVLAQSLSPSPASKELSIDIDVDDEEELRNKAHLEVNRDESTSCSLLPENMQNASRQEPGLEAMTTIQIAPKGIPLDAISPDKIARTATKSDTHTSLTRPPTGLKRTSHTPHSSMSSAVPSNSLLGKRKADLVLDAETGSPSTSKRVRQHIGGTLENGEIPAAAPVLQISQPYIPPQPTEVSKWGIQLTDIYLRKCHGSPRLDDMELFMATVNALEHQLKNPYMCFEWWDKFKIISGLEKLCQVGFVDGESLDKGEVGRRLQGRVQKVIIMAKQKLNGELQEKWKKTAITR